MLSLLPKFGDLVGEGFLVGEQRMKEQYTIFVIQTPFREIRKYVFVLLDQVNELVGKMLDFNIQRQG